MRSRTAAPVTNNRREEWLISMSAPLDKDIDASREGLVRFRIWDEPVFKFHFASRHNAFTMARWSVRIESRLQSLLVLCGHFRGFGEHRNDRAGSQVRQPARPAAGSTQKASHGKGFDRGGCAFN